MPYILFQCIYSTTCIVMPNFHSWTSGGPRSTMFLCQLLYTSCINCSMLYTTNSSMLCVNSFMLYVHCLVSTTYRAIVVSYEPFQFIIASRKPPRCIVACHLSHYKSSPITATSYVLNTVSQYLNVKSTNHLYVDEIGRNHPNVDTTSKQVSGINILQKTLIVLLLTEPSKQVQQHVGR